MLAILNLLVLDHEWQNLIMFYHITWLFSHIDVDPSCKNNLENPLNLCNTQKSVFLMGLCLYLLCIHFIFIVEVTQLYDYTPKYRFVTYMCVELFVCQRAFFFRNIFSSTRGQQSLTCRNVLWKQCQPLAVTLFDITLFLVTSWIFYDGIYIRPPLHRAYLLNNLTWLKEYRFGLIKPKHAEPFSM